MGDVLAQKSKLLVYDDSFAKKVLRIQVADRQNFRSSKWKLIARKICSKTVQTQVDISSVHIFYSLTKFVLQAEERVQNITECFS
jgi:hypothetical protein